MQLYALDNAHGVAARIVRRADGLKLAGAAGLAFLAKNVRYTVDPLLKEEAPVRTGQLRDWLRAGTFALPGGTVMVHWVDPVPYLPYVIEGTGIYHRPQAHSAWDVSGPQAFTVNGQHVFAMATHHLGQHPDAFPARAMARAKPALEALLFATGKQIMVGFRA